MDHYKNFNTLILKWNLKEAQKNLAIQKVKTRDNKFFWLKYFIRPSEYNHSNYILKHFCGKGSVYLVDQYMNYQLLEDIRPGQTIEFIEEKKALDILIKLTKKLHKPLKPPLKIESIKDWALGFERNNTFINIIGKRLFDYAKGIYYDLMHENDSWFPLHGDLHHKNILSATRGKWLSIDPKGVMGPITYEYGCFLRNINFSLCSQKKIKSKIETHLSYIANKTDTDKEKIRLWTFSQAILASLWALEDNNFIWKDFIEIAKLYGFKA